MKIRLDLSLVHGAVRTEMFPQGLELQRLVPDMMDYCNDHGAREIRARCPSGIRIRFRTNSAFVRLPFTFGPTARQIFNFDVFCDGQPAAFSGKDGLLEFQLDGKEHEIAILPPHLVQCYFGNLEIADGAIFAPVPKPEKKLLFLGDSIMQGMTVSRPSMSYALRLADAEKAECINLSIGGLTALKVLGDFVQQYSWNELYIAFGTNDFSQNKTVDDFLADMDAILQKTAVNGKLVTVISPIWLLSVKETNPSGIKFPVYREALEKMVRSKYPQVRFIDGTTLLPYDEQYYIDQIHPNDPGEDLFFRNLTAQLH